MSVPLSTELQAYAEATPDPEARAKLEKWASRAAELEAAEPETAEQHRAAGVAGLRKAIRDRQIEMLLVAKCCQRARALGLRGPWWN